MSDTQHEGDGPVDEHARPAGGGTRRAGRRRSGAGSGGSGWGSGSGRGSGWGEGRDRGARRPRGGSRADDGPDGGSPDGALDGGRDGAAPGRPEDDRDPEEVARAICLRALTGAMKTRKQLADLLAKKDVPEAAAAAVLDRFTEVGLIDDAAFAAAWVSSRQSGRGLSRRALAQELRAKGVDGELAQEALEQVDSQDEWDTARRLVARKMPSMARLDRVTAERRLVGMLARKGYGGGLAGWVVREALDDRESTLLAADEAADELDDGPETAPPPAGSWSNRRRPAPQADPWAELEAARAAKAAGAAAEPATETGEGQVRRIARRSTAPAPDWLGDDTP